MNKDSFDKLISDLEVVETVKGSNFPVKRRSNSHIHTMDLLFISDNVKYLPDHIGSYSAGYLYRELKVITIGALVANLKIARDMDYLPSQPSIPYEVGDEHVMVYFPITLCRKVVLDDCNSK